MTTLGLSHDFLNHSVFSLARWSAGSLTHLLTALRAFPLLSLTDSRTIYPASGRNYIARAGWPGTHTLTCIRQECTSTFSQMTWLLPEKSQRQDSCTGSSAELRKPQGGSGPENQREREAGLKGQVSSHPCPWTAEALSSGNFRGLHQIWTSFWKLLTRGWGCPPSTLSHWR